MIRMVQITKDNLLHYLDAILQVEALSFPTPWTPLMFKEEVRNPISHLWALVVDDLLLAYICFWLFDSEIQLISIAVTPQKRRRGLGHFLLKKMIELGTNKGVRSIWLEVRPSSRMARNLYKKMGFQEVGRRPRYYRDPDEDAILMDLTLSPTESYGQALH